MQRRKQIITGLSTALKTALAVRNSFYLNTEIARTRQAKFPLRLFRLFGYCLLLAQLGACALHSPGKMHQGTKGVRGSKPYTIRGKTYHPLQSAHGFQEEGIASWYGRDFHGKPTASGEPYNMHALTAAHKILPLGTDVRVTNRMNGRFIVVRINDRGPFIDRRIIDLSHTGAKRLGVLEPGTAPVIVQAINTKDPEQSSQIKRQTVSLPDSSQKKSSRMSPLARKRLPRQNEDILSRRKEKGHYMHPSPCEVPGRDSFYIQVGAFGHPKNAQSLVALLNKKGQTARENYNRQQALWQVQVGPYTALDEASRHSAALRANYPENFVIVE